jgi:HprK-related kinase A
VCDISKKKIIASTFFLNTGPFTVSISTKIKAFSDTFFSLYPYNKITETSVFADFHVTLVKPVNPIHFFKPQVDFLLDSKSVFNPLPFAQVFPIFEWGLNWAIGNRCNYYLVIHAGVLEKDGCGILLPGTPGAGKSTLCAALCLNGWRLLSDELALLDLRTGLCVPLPRPVSLKGESINIIRKYSEAAFLSATVHDTQKGSVAYLQIPKTSVEQQAKSVKLRAVIFPKFQVDIDGYDLKPITKAKALIRVADQTFNYSILGKSAYELLKTVLKDSQCYEFFYNGNLAEAELVFNQIIEEVKAS